MNLPPIDPAILAQFNIKPEDRLETVDFGLRIPNKQKQKPLTSDECIKLFGAREAVQMNFVPQMLTALAFEQAEGFINYCRDHRLSEYKKHNREMRKCIDEYNYELRQSYGKAYAAYQSYYQRLYDKVEVDLFKIWCTFTNEAARQFLRYEHKDIPARLALVKMLLSFVEEFDCQMDKLIESKTKLPCERKRDPYPYLVGVLCLDLVERFDIKMNITEQMALCVRVLANKAHVVVDEIMRDEDAEEAARTYINILSFSSLSDAIHFENGAKWADEYPINVWHTTNEKPRLNQWFLAQIGDNAFDTFIMAMNKNKDWREWSKGINIKRWAYIKDLLPKGGKE